MGWNDHSPAFERIELRMYELLDDALDNGETLSEEDAYMLACDDISEDMRIQSLYRVII